MQCMCDAMHMLSSDAQQNNVTGRFARRMTHCVPECPLQKEAPLAKVVKAVAVLLACITAGSQKQCSCTNLHRQATSDAR